MNWKQAEFMGMGYFVAKGYRILAPVNGVAVYDFVAEKDGSFIRVNVKVAGRKYSEDSNSWSISKPGGRNRGSDERHDGSGVDIFLVWLPHEQRFVEMAGDAFDGRAGKSVLVPKALLLQ